MLCCESKNLKDKVTHLCKVTRRHFFLSYSLLSITVPDFLPFLNASSVQKWKKTKIYKSEYRAGNTTQWFCRAVKMCIISVKIYAGIMVMVTFEIKSKVLLAARVAYFFVMQVIENNFLRLA